MAEPVLYLELDARGIFARLMERPFSREKKARQCQVDYSNLSPAETDATPFQQGLDMISEHLDLKSCISAVVLIPSRSVCFRNLSLPFKTAKKISKVLPLELSSRLPQPEETYISDYLVHDVEFDPGQHMILSASMPQAMVADIVDTLKQYRINTDVITPKGYAAAITSYRPSGKNGLVVHMNDQDVTLVLMVNNSPAVVRTFDAEGISPETLAMEIRRTIMGFSQRFGGRRQFALTLSLPAHLVDAIQKAFPGETISVLNHSEPFLLTERMPEFLFNLCTEQFHAHSFFRRYRVNLALTASIVLLSFSLTLASMMGDIADLEQRIKEKRETAVAIIKETYPGKKNIPLQAPLMLMQSYVKNALKNTISDGKSPLEHRRYQAVDVLFELSESMPATIDVEISRLMMKDQKLVITGSTDNYNNVDKLKGLIEKNDLFTKVDIIGAEAGKLDRVNFKFNIELE